MELLKHDAAWFSSEAGCNMYHSLNSLEDRSIFLYSYLKKIAIAEFDQDQTLFKAAFFFADGIFGSSLPYSNYPDLINPAKNPFVAYLDNAEHYPGAEAVYFIFLSILHKIADPTKRNAWIYSQQMENPEYVEQKLLDTDKCFYAGEISMASADAFAIDESLQLVQLKLIWLMGLQ